MLNEREDGSLRYGVLGEIVCGVVGSELRDYFLLDSTIVSFFSLCIYRHLTTVITVIVMWLSVPAYWGSLWRFNKYTDKLTVRVIDRDDAEIGQTFSRGLLSQINLNFFATDSSELPTAAEVAHYVVEEGVWASMPFYLLGEMVTLAGVALLSSRFSRRKPDRKLVSTPISFLTSKKL